MTRSSPRRPAVNQIVLLKKAKMATPMATTTPAWTANRTYWRMMPPLFHVGRIVVRTTSRAIVSNRLAAANRNPMLGVAL